MFVIGSQVYIAENNKLGYVTKIENDGEDILVYVTHLNDTGDQMLNEPYKIDQLTPWG